VTGEIDTGYLTVQQDVFDSGLARTIGMNALGVWLAIKRHADYNTGECWPGIRRLVDVTGLASATVQRAIKTLQSEKLLRVIETGCGTRSSRYVARERLVVYLGKQTLCTIVLDYVPARIPGQLAQIKGAIKSGNDVTDAFAECEIIPGEGFTWDETARVLRTTIPAEKIRASLLKNCE
jgi:hypothetical protein